MSLRARVMSGPGRLRWRAAVASARLRGRLAGAAVTIRSGSGVRAGRRVRIEIRGSARLDVGEGCRFHDDVLLDLHGGSVTLGDNVELRPRAVLRVGAGGDLRLAGENLVSFGTTIHASESITIGRRSTCAEYVSIIDSDHRRPDGSGNFRDTRVSAPVVIGDDVWLAAKSTVTAGVSIGDRAVAAASAVVTKDVPADTMVGGVPARPIDVD